MDSITTVDGNIGIGRLSSGTDFDITTTKFDLTVAGDITSAGNMTIGGQIGTLTADNITAARSIVVGDGEAAESAAAEHTIITDGQFGISSDEAGVSATITGAKTTVTAGELVLGNSSTGQQNVVVQNKATLTIQNDAMTTFHNTDAGGTSNSLLIHGTNASFAGGLTIGERGQLVVERSPAGDNVGGTTISNLAVGARNAAVGGLRIQSAGGLAMADNAVLNVLEALPDPDAPATAEEAYGDIVITDTGTIDMGANSRVNAGTLVVDRGTVGNNSEIGGTGANAVLNLKGLTVTAGSTFNGRAGVVINGGVGDIQGTHVMVDTESYDSLVIGAEGTFSFNSGTGKTLSVGTATGATGEFILTQGGTFGNINAGALTIAGAKQIDVVKNTGNTGGAIIQADGDIIATDSILNVGARLDVNVSSAEIAVKQLKITAGDTLVNGDGTVSSVEQAVIGGDETARYLILAGGSVTEWHKGVRIAKNGTVGLYAPGTNGGTFIVGGDIVLDGGTIQGSTDTTALSFAKEGATTPKVSVIGAGGGITGWVDFDGMDMVVNITEPDDFGDSEIFLEDNAQVDGIANVTLTKGEIGFGIDATLNMTGDFSIANGAGFYADRDAAITTTAPAGSSRAFTLDRGGWMAADGGVVTIDGFANADLNGTIVAGLQGDNVSAGRFIFDDDTDVVIGNNTQFIFDADLTESLENLSGITYADDETVIIQGGQGKIDFTDRTVKSGLGQFGIERFLDEVGAGGDKVSITSAKNNVWDGLTTQQQITQMQNNLRSALNDNGLGAYATRELAKAVHGALIAADGSANEVYVSPPSADGRPNVAGENNLLQLDMIGTATQSIHESQLASLLGVNVNNGILATIGSVNTFGTQTTNRLANNRAIFNEASSSDYANASILLNSEYVNRIWAGAIGHWEDGDRRHGIDGYKYDSYGFILGYDRYFGCNLVAGVAFAYTTGDFEAKSAINDDSEMDNYSVQGYLSYNALNGIFATLMGGTPTPTTTTSGAPTRTSTASTPPPATVKTTTRTAGTSAASSAMAGPRSGTSSSPRPSA